MLNHLVEQGSLATHKCNILDNLEEALSGAFSIHSFQHCPVEFSVMMEISCICVIQCGSHVGSMYYSLESPLSI